MRVPGLNQDLTYWGPGTENQYGVRTHDSPILIKGRWEDKHQQVTTLGGQDIVSKAMALVDRELLVDGYLASGDHTAQAEPTVVPEAAAIQSFEAVNDLRSVSKVLKAVM